MFLTTNIVKNGLCTVYTLVPGDKMTIVFGLWKTEMIPLKALQTVWIIHAMQSNMMSYHDPNIVLYVTGCSITLQTNPLSFTYTSHSIIVLDCNQSELFLSWRENQSYSPGATVVGACATPHVCTQGNRKRDGSGSPDDQNHYLNLLNAWSTSVHASEVSSRLWTNGNCVR